MEKSHKALICLSIIILSSPILFNQVNLWNRIELNTRFPQTEYGYENESQAPLTSSPTNNYEIIEEIFTQNLAKYSSMGYFPQLYEPSLQATYYALYILEALGNLDQINQSSITDYIMSHYDSYSHIFLDKYSYRYLDTDFSQGYYALTSILEVNCYALLSLDILGQLGIIDTQDSIDFIWSCYNPEGSENGFIGQPYSPNLIEEFKIATMDNTFFAVRTLDLLIDDWSSYNDEKTSIVQYITSLQLLNGGFLNDNDTSFDSFASPMFEPNLLSSYYCIKSLEVLNSVNSINIGGFHQYLNSLYDDTVHSFQLYIMGIQDFCNIVATALGLELSDITGYTGLNRIDVINFLLTNLNNLGNWDSSTWFRNHELIDTYQIIRSLKESGDINQLTLQEKNQISNAILFYEHYIGFSLISNDYMSIEHIHSIINSFDLFNRISEVDIQGLYSLIDGCYRDLVYCHGFSASTNLVNYIGFRSRPIEYYNLGYYHFTEETDGLFNHKFDYKALDSLLKISKLNDFGLNYNLMDFISNIIDSQFLESGFENYGAFLPFFTYSLRSPEAQNKSIFLEYSYYAIKTLELLVNQLNLGPIVDLSFNKGALYGFIRRNVYESNSVLHFNPQHTSNLETILQDTYYMIYILKAINLFDLNMQKIKEFILQNINYSNIKNIYYSHKITEILGLEIQFDVELTSNLVKQLYIEGLSEFFESIDSQVINQEIFLWVCEMARTSDLYIECNYHESVYLGSVNTITTSFSNLIFREYGEFTSVTFESEQFGILNLEKQYDNSYQINFLVPVDPNYYPSVEGNIFIYDHSEIIGHVPIFFRTSLEQIIEYNITKNIENVLFMVNISRRVSSEFQAVYNSSLYIQVFENNNCTEVLNFTRVDFEDFSKFSFTYEVENTIDYYFNISLVDNFYPNGVFLFEYELQSELRTPPNNPIPPVPIDLPIDVNGILLAFVAALITVVIMAIIVSKGRKIKEKVRNGGNRDALEKIEGISPRYKYSKQRRRNNNIDFEDWD